MSSGNGLDHSKVKVNFSSLNGLLKTLLYVFHAQGTITSLLLLAFFLPLAHTEIKQGRRLKHPDSPHYFLILLNRNLPIRHYVNFMN